MDQQDPLPELSQVWRRVLTFIVTCGLLCLLSFGLGRVPAVQVLPYARGLMVLLALVWAFYFAGASMSELTRFIKAAELIKHRITTEANKEPPK